MLSMELLKYKTRHYQMKHESSEHELQKRENTWRIVRKSECGVESVMKKLENKRLNKLFKIY